MEDFLNQLLFNINGTAITTGKVIAVCGIGIFAFIIQRIIVKKGLAYYRDKGNLDEKSSRKIELLTFSCLLLIFLISAINIFSLNQDLYPNRFFVLSGASILKGLLIIQIARLLLLFLTRIINGYYQRRIVNEEGTTNRLQDLTKENHNQIANSSIKIAVFLLALFLFFQNFQFNPELLTLHQDTANPFPLKLSTVLIVLLILTLGRVFIWVLTQLILLRYYKKNKINLGTQFAINQLISYFIYVFAILTALHFLKINMTVFWGGLAALLVGVGLGLQQTFNDLFSGILLLFERGIEVGEVLEIDGTVGNLKKIGLRTSVIESRDNVTIIVPNSKLVVNNVINWSHYDDKVRFKVAVGVAYGTDTALVKKLLLDTAKEHSFVLKYPSPSVRFTDFGSSSLDFELLFYSKNFSIIEDVKSDIRFEIDRKFRAENIEIPFPQNDIWIRKNG